jgi:hypothetical protein
MTTLQTTRTQASNISPRHAQQYRAYIRQQASRYAYRTTPIEVVDGDMAPRCQGESYRWETPNGTRVHHPHAYRRHFGRPVYCASTNRVQVGREWLATHHIPECAMKVSRSR